MRFERVIGNNCRYLMNMHEISEDVFANELGYTTSDVKKLLDGRLFVNDQDIRNIAAYFGVDDEYMLMDHGNAVYSGPGFLHCIDRFISDENREKVLDIFDMYCDLKEMVAQ